jgi:uncharacterized protein (TIRG00374 family)
LSALSQLQKYFEGKRLIIPIALGVLVGLLFFYKDFDKEAYDVIEWQPRIFIWLFLAILMFVFRYLGYVLRLRILSEKLLGWKESLQLVALWEFCSAISPGIVGGTAAAFVLLAQERKLGTGKATAIVLATSYLDVLFYVVTVPILLLFTGLIPILPDSVGPAGSKAIITYFLIAYLILLLWAILVYIGIFRRPHWIKHIITRLFSLRFFKKWKQNAVAWGDEIVISAKAFNDKGRIFWFKAFGATLFSWTARFVMVNFLILALGNGMHFLAILSKQLVMWGALLIPFTPGASGLAELLFPAFLGEYFANDQLANSTSVLWRLISYYPYLFLGFIVFPVWIKRVIKQQKTKQEVSS